jgi:hypothetical protein
MRAFILVFFFVLASGGLALAQAQTYLAGTVLADGKPISGATVTATGNNLTLHATTDLHGRFSLHPLPFGVYEVTVAAPAGSASLTVDVGTAGADITVTLSAIKNIGHTAVGARPARAGSGTDLTLPATVLNESPASGSLPSILLQLPGAARGANGVVHINGDHGDVNYIVDGVQIPQELNRNIGTEFDPNDVANIEVLSGAYPAQYGERFAEVINVNTRNGTGPAGFTGNLDYGSYAQTDGTISYHTPLGKGNLVVASSNDRGDHGLDPPNFSSPHDDFSNENQFLRYTQPLGKGFLNLTASHSYQTYQIPNDVDNGEPADTDDVETQDDTFASLQLREPIGDEGSLSFGPFVKVSHILDFGDPSNDFAYGEALNVAAGGAQTNCANALVLSNPTVVNGVVTGGYAPNPAIDYVNGTCGYSLYGDRQALDTGGNLDYDNRSAKHDVRFGVYYDATHVDKTYAVTLQSGNFLAPIFTPATPGAAYTVVDDSPNVGHLLAYYLQDSWKLGDLYQLDYGLRQDLFIVSSTDFDRGFAQTSPRIKLTRFFSDRASVYAFYGRYFTPFSMENVGPVAAYTLNLPTGLPLAGFDLKPERDSTYEIGGHLPIGNGDLGLRAMQKDATDLIDDTEVGVTNLHQDINYALGRIATQSAYYQYPLARAGRLYASVTHTYSVNKDCETQLLAPCFPEVVNGAPDWTPADHDQRVDVNAGIIWNDGHGGWWSGDGEYGSGLSTSLDPDGGITCAGFDYLENIGGPCKRTPHTIFNAERGIALSHNVVLTIRMENLLNDRYMVTYLNAQGNHWAPPRTFDVGLRFGPH